MPLSVLRLQNVYGPGQSLTNPYTGIVSLFSQLARDGESIPLYEDGEITRDFVLIDDVVSALVAALDAPPSTPVRTLDVGTGVRTTIRDLATTVAQFHQAPRAARHRPVPRRRRPPRGLRRAAHGRRARLEAPVVAGRRAWPPSRTGSRDSSPEPGDRASALPIAADG